MSGLRVAACQLPDHQDGPASALAALQSQLAEVGTADVVCCPEAFLTGYTLSGPAAEHRAISLDSPAFATVLAALADVRPVVVLGLFERAGDALFNSAVLIAAGAVVGRYRKRHPHEEGISAGHDIPVFEINGARVAIGICSDARNVDDGGRLAGLDLDVILYPLNNMLPAAVAEPWRHRHLEILADRARQTGAWVISADVVGSRDGLVSYGTSAILTPGGVVGYRVPESTAGTVLAEVPARHRP